MTQTRPAPKWENRKIYLEWMRLLACGMVIYNHTPAYTMYMVTDGAKQGLYMVLTIVCRLNIPLFFMISGALLLPRQESCVTVLKKRTGRILLAMLISEFGLYGLDHLVNLYRGEPSYFGLRVFFAGVISRSLNNTVPYWYLYAYLGFLFMLPFLQRMAKDLQKQDFYWLLFLHALVFSFFPLMNHRLQITNNRLIPLSGDFSVPLATSQALFFPMAGYYLEHHVDIKSLSKPKLLGLFAAACGAVFISCICIKEQATWLGSYTQDYTKLFDYLLAITVFLLIKYSVVTAKNTPLRAAVSKAVSLAGSLTFGIYLLHVYFLTFFYPAYEGWMRAVLPGFSVLSLSLLFCLLCMLLGGALTLLLQKLPLFRRFL